MRQKNGKLRFLILETRETRMNRKVLFFSVLLFSSVIFLGCGQSGEQKQESLSAVELALTADCIAQYHKTNGSAYLTQQQHSFNPTSGYFRMAAKEPTGNLHYTLLQNQYNESSKQKTHPLSDMPANFCTNALAAAIYYGFCAGGELLDTASLIAGENIKLEGRWYQPLETDWPKGSIAVKLLRSVETNHIELVQVEDFDNGLTWLLRSYNIRYCKELDKNLPMKIDVCDIRDGIASKELMIQFEYTDIKIAQIPGISADKKNLTAN